MVAQFWALPAHRDPSYSTGNRHDRHFTFMASWTDFLWPLIVLNTTDKMLLEQGPSFFSRGVEFQEEGARVAGASIAVIPILLVFLFAQKYFVRGIASTGFKS